MELEEQKSDKKTMIIAIITAIVVLAVLVGISLLLYNLGGTDQSALERVRGISIIFIVLLGGLTVVLLSAVVVALTYLIFQTKDRLIPLLDETTDTVKRARTTVEFMSDEAVRPMIAAAGTAARVRAMANAFRSKR